MSELLEIIKQWPVIIQGALGSAVFAFTLSLAQRIFTMMNHRISSLSVKTQINELQTEKLKICMDLAKGRDKALFSAPMLYRMSRPFLRGLIWLVMGLMLGNVSFVLAIVGYFGSIYYFVNALNIVSPYDFDGNHSQKLEEIDTKINELKKRYNKSPE
ncbi:hypothetical protein KFZ68_06995 [Photobacterium damselae]|uniref:hypothetical protein n=1 Tax=Photobacterium damselae TaxID=38293 RepID=UPI00254316E0